LYKRYGERGAAMTANVITYRNRMAGREMEQGSGFRSRPWTRFLLRLHLGISRRS
jgi:hypothetical protein